ncbi:MAG: YraN family protein [Acidobacteria bacterium]|nr:YraN family protein [Acidobacteriota bacterium]
MKLLAKLFERGLAEETERQRLGRLGEDAAYRHLRKLGYTMVARNYRARDGRGEVDLIGWDGQKLAFIEVKTRITGDFGAPEEAIDSQKRLNILGAAAVYLRRAGLGWSCARFDTVSVIWQNPVRIEVHKDAFSPRSAAARRR